MSGVTFVLGNGGIFYRILMGARNHNPCVHFAPDINPAELQLFHLFLLRGFIDGVLLHSINERIYGDKFSYGEFLVFIGGWIMTATIQGQ